MNKPNLFAIATSELSQDAFITWLLQWADKKYIQIDKHLHSCAVSFVQALLGQTTAYKIENVEAGRQWNNIDVWAEVNNEYFIVIEDKKGTQEHSDQLVRYSEIAKEHYKNENIKIILIYFKMEEQGKYSAIEEAGYSLFTREKMLSILEQYQVNIDGETENNIISDYYLYLKRLDEQINNFKTLPIEQWGRWYSWKGFFATIQKEIDGNWDYVPNPSGGFLGFWWHWNSKDLNGKKFDFYLQLEYEKFIFKLNVYESDYRNEIRDYYRKKLYSAAESQNINIHQYGRIGEYMGVAKLNEDYRILNENGLIDITATIDNLKKMEKLIDLVANEISK
ncbi:MAG: PD-(D/E)XK nuclease family protein [Thiolinea sp.]